MASIHVVSYVQATVNGKKYEFGSLGTPVAIAAASNLVHEITRSVATNTTVTLYDATVDIADFDFLLIASDQTIILEYTTDQNGGVGDEFFTEEWAGSGTANVYGVPRMFTSDASYANYTSNFGG